MEKVFVLFSKSYDSLIALFSDSVISFDLFTTAIESSLAKISCLDPKRFFGSNQIFTGTPILVSVSPDALSLVGSDL